MFVIVKNTLRCNRNCWFCSDYGNRSMTWRQVRNIYFREGKPVMLIIGGEPMMLGKNYYLKLLNSGVKFSMQSNLILYDKTWNEVFQHENFMGLSVSGDKMPLSEFLDKFERLRNSTKLNPMVLIIAFSEKVVFDWYKVAKSRDFSIKFNYLMPLGRLKNKKMSVSEYFSIMGKLVDVWDVKQKVEPLSSLYNGDKICPYLNCLIENVDIWSIETNGRKFFCGALGSLKMTKEEVLDNVKIPDKCWLCEYFGICRGCVIRNMMIDSDYCRSAREFFGKIYAKKESNILCQTN